MCFSPGDRTGNGILMPSPILTPLAGQNFSIQIDL